MTLDDLLKLSLEELQKLKPLVDQAIAHKASVQDVAISAEVAAIDLAADALEDKKFGRGDG